MVPWKWGAKRDEVNLSNPNELKHLLMLRNNKQAEGDDQLFADSAAGSKAKKRKVVADEGDEDSFQWGHMCHWSQGSSRFCLSFWISLAQVLWLIPLQGLTKGQVSLLGTLKSTTSNGNYSCIDCCHWLAWASIKDKKVQNGKSKAAMLVRMLWKSGKVSPNVFPSYDLLKKLFAVADASIWLLKLSAS